MSKKIKSKLPKTWWFHGQMDQNDVAKGKGH